MKRQTPHHPSPITWLVICLFISCLTPASANQQTAKGIVLKGLEEEMQRAKELLTRKGDPAPYFICYQVFETDQTSISASRGALRNSSTNRSRTLDVELRAGDYQLDNSHQLRGQPDFMGRIGGSIPLTIEDDLDAIKSAIWLETDRKYKAAVERLIQVKANRSVRVQEEDKSADFSREEPQTAALPVAKIRLNVAEWEKRTREYSALFNQHTDILEAFVSLTAEATTKYLVNSEGASLQHGRTHARLGLYASTRAEDGMEIYRYEAFDMHTPEGLPDDNLVKKTIEKIVGDLQALRTAPVVEPYTGPAILSGRASGVFFHEIFGHRIEGHRQKNEEEGQTFTKKIDQSVLPDFISVYDDPTSIRSAGADLNGHYLYDDEGVKAQRVTVVENGVLKNFLLSRSPVAGFDRSNGHGRKAAGYKVVGRQGNLLVQASKTVSEEKLRQMLIEECKQQGKPFGLVFKDISGGFTITGRGFPQAFQVTPIMVYRVYTDGRPDELVRGADLIGTPLISFSKIIASSDKLDVFNGYCGAESGFIPVSAISPSILTAQIEVQKKPKSSDRAPILPPPGRDRAENN
ncbi:MAG: TldD/PmbA family protein [Acidobacteria bacterium]|nr:TldD/PmbA family protein [Acidobacteriota bacterium]